MMTIAPNGEFKVGDCARVKVRGGFVRSIIRGFFGSHAVIDWTDGTRTTRPLENLTVSS